MRVAIPPIPSVQCIVGGPSAGKTAALVQQANECSRGINATGQASNILFICASPAHCNTVRKQLDPCIRVCTPREIALAVLAAEGQRSRMLDPYEQQFLFEDMRTTGIPQKPLRRLLEFMYASFATLNSWNSDWIEMREERLVYNTLMDNLVFTGGVCETEITCLAAQLLANNETLRASNAATHVLVDDYHLLSRASQVFCNLLAQESLTVAGDAQCKLQAQEAYPNPQGLDEFKEFHENATCQTLENTRRNTPEQMDTYQTVRDEFQAILALLQTYQTEDDLLARVAVVSTNSTWRKNFVRMLTEAGIPFRQTPAQIHVRDFSDELSCGRIAKDAEEKLTTNPNDGVALRSLYGLGDYIAHSAELKRLREGNPGTSLAELNTQQPLERIEANRAHYTALWKEEPAATTEASHACPALFVGSPQELCGQHFDYVIFGGYVEGWVPARAYFDAVGDQKTRLLEQALRQREYARRAAGERLIFTTFEECELEFAERFKLHYEHIYLRDGLRTCKLSAPKLD